MSALRAPRAFNPMLLLAGAALGALLLVAGARWSHRPMVSQEAPVVHSRALLFEDTPSGAVAVRDAHSGASVALFEGEQGFVRGVLRAMARARKARQLDHQMALQLQNHADGTLSLFDAETGERINLESFGRTQRATFAQLQDSPQGPLPDPVAAAGTRGASPSQTP